MSSKKVLLIDEIIDSAETQGRAAIDDDHVADLVAAWLAKAEIPALTVYFDGSKYYLSDGFHRLAAARIAKRASVPAEVKPGSKRDAWLAALQANQGHGLRRSNADKRRLVTLALNDDELVKWSDNRVAEHIGVTQPFVSEIRKQLITVISSPAAQVADAPKIGKDGKARKAPKKTTGTDFGTRSKPAAEAIDQEPPAKPKISGGATFDVAEIEAAQAADVPFAEKVRLHNLELERYCQRILKAFKDDVPQSAWLDDSRHGIVGDSINSAVDTVRAVKAFDKPCPRCNGTAKLGAKDCHWCKACGFMPERSYEMAGGQ